MKRRAPAYSSTLSDQRDLDIHKENLYGLGHTGHCIHGMESVIVTITGYKGQEKDNLIELIVETGAIYTADLTKCTTHLICWKFEGPKYALARKLGVTIVNHRWLEKCWEERRKLLDSDYIMNCGEEIGPLSWKPQKVAEVTMHKISPLSDDMVILFPNSPMQTQGSCSKCHALSDASSHKTNQEGVTNDKRPFMRIGDKQVASQTDLVATPSTNISNKHKAKIEVSECSTSKQNMEKRRTKTRRLVKKSDKCSILNYFTHLQDDIGEPTNFSNSGENKDSGLFENSGTVSKPNSGASPSEPGIEFIRCTPAENRKSSSDWQPLDSEANMDLDMENNVGMSLLQGTPATATNISGSEIACAICWTESSSSRGVLGCGHRFCFKCIKEWACEATSKSKEPTCPLCKQSFHSITIKNHATSSDQKIYSQTIPEGVADNIYQVHGHDASTCLLKMKLQCIICGGVDEEQLVKCYSCGRRALHEYCLDPRPGVTWTCGPCTSRRRPFYGGLP